MPHNGCLVLFFFLVNRKRSISSATFLFPLVEGLLYSQATTRASFYSFRGSILMIWNLDNEMFYYSLSLSLFYHSFSIEKWTVSLLEPLSLLLLLLKLIDFFFFFLLAFIEDSQWEPHSDWICFEVQCGEKAHVRKDLLLPPPQPFQSEIHRTRVRCKIVLKATLWRERKMSWG